MTVLPLLFQFGYILLLFLIWLLWLRLPNNTMLNRSGKSGHPCLVLEFSGEHLAFYHQVWYWLWVCCKWSLLCWDMFPLYPFQWELYHKWMLNFVSCFFCIYWDDYVIFILPFVNVMYHTDWFGNVEPSLLPWNKSNLIMVYDLFNMLLDFVC